MDKMMTLIKIWKGTYFDVDTQAIANGEFIEHATFAGNTYGTSTIAVERVRDKGENNFLLKFHIFTFSFIFTFKFSPLEQAP